MHESLGCFTLRRLGQPAVFVATGTGLVHSFAARRLQIIQGRFPVLNRVPLAGYFGDC
jgi:hypothetical protein